MVRGIRLEAGIFSWDDLLEEQQRAIRSAVRVVEELVRTADAGTSHHSADSGRKQLWSVPYAELRPPAPTNVVMFDGARGMGKTTAALTLMSMLGWKKGASSLVSGLPAELADSENLARVVPLGIIDARPLPDDALEALWLIRPLITLADDLCRAEGRRITLDEVTPRRDHEAVPRDRPLVDLKRAVLKAAAGGWSGFRTPDTASVEEVAVDLEQRDRLRASLGPSWDEFVGRLRSRVRQVSGANDQPVFAILVDDVDLNFASTFKILELIRMFAHPGILFIVTGDSALLLRTITRALARAESRFDPIFGHLGDDSETRALAFELLQKLIPLAHRMCLAELAADEWRDLVMRFPSGSGAAGLIEAIIGFPGALSTLSPRTVRSTIEFATMLGTVRRSQEIDSSARSTADPLAFTAWLSGRRARRGGGALPADDAVQIANKQLHLSQHSEAISQAASRYLSRREHRGRAPVWVCAGERVPPGGEGEIVEVLVARWAIGEDIDDAPLLQFLGDDAWSPVYCVTASVEGEHPEVAPWPAPTFGSLAEFIAFNQAWSARQLPEVVDEEGLRYVLFAYLEALTQLEASRAGDEAAAERRHGAAVEVRDDDPISGLVSALAQPDDAPDGGAMRLARLAYELFLFDGLLPKGIRHDFERIVASLSPGARRVVARRMTYFDALPRRHSRPRSRTAGAVLLGEDATWDAVLAQFDTGVRHTPFTAANLLRYSGLRTSTLGGEVVCGEVAARLEPFHGLADALPERLQALTFRAASSATRAALLATADGTTVELSDAAERQLWEIDQSSTLTLIPSSGDYGDYVGAEAVVRGGPAVDVVSLFKTGDMIAGPAPTLRSPSPMLVVASELGVDDAVRFLLARDIAASAERLTPLEESSVALPSALPFAGHAIGHPSATAFVVPWFGPRFRTTSECLAFGFAMARAIRHFGDLDGSPRFRPTGALLAASLDAVAAVHDGADIGTLEPQVFTHPTHEKISELVARLCRQTDTEWFQRFTLPWLATEVSLWLAPEYRLPPSLGDALWSALDRVGLVWKDVVVLRKARLEVIASLWRYGDARPSAKSLTNAIGGGHGAWRRVSEAAGGP